MSETTSEPRDTHYPHAVNADNEEPSDKDQQSPTNDDQSDAVSDGKFKSGMEISGEIPFVKYVLIGGGMASYYAMKTIKKMENDAQILMIGQESSVPYSRPPLSKELWDSSYDDLENWTFKDYNGDRKTVFYDTKTFITVNQALEFPNTDKVYFLNGSVSSIDTAEESVILSNGAKVKYGKLLIATGGSPKILPIVKELPKETQSRVMTFRGVSLV